MSELLDAGGTRYAVGAVIGEGGMATVHAGQRADGSPVAIKALKPEMAMQPEFVSMFLDEARLSVRLSHPNIVRTHSFGNSSGVPFLVMELLNGPDLSRVLERRGALDLEAALAIVWQVANALAYAHELGADRGAPLSIVHRDVSPSNILLDSSGAAKLLDFGIAKATTRLAERTRTGLRKGKDGYMSPEQCVGVNLDRRSDVFSLATVAYEALCGERLFRRDLSESSFTVMERVAAARVPREPLARASVPAELAEILLAALEPVREDRTASCAQFAASVAAASERLFGWPPEPTSPLITALASAESNR